MNNEEKNLWCDGGKECRCICHQTDYPLPEDFPIPPPQEEPWVAEWNKEARVFIEKHENAEVGESPVHFNSLATDQFVIAFIQKTLEADRKERGLMVENVIKELRGKGLYDDDLYAHFYRIIKGY